MKDINRTRQVLHCLVLATLEIKGNLFDNNIDWTRENVILLTLQYGKSIRVLQVEVEQILDTPLSQLMKL